MVIRIKLSTLFWGLLSLPIFPVWLCWYGDRENHEGCVALGIVGIIVLLSVYLLSVLPTHRVVTAGEQIKTEHGIEQEVTLRQRSVLTLMPYSWDHEDSYVRLTRESGEHIWIHKVTGESTGDGVWDVSLDTYNAQNLDKELIQQVISD